MAEQGSWQDPSPLRGEPHGRGSSSRWCRPGLGPSPAAGQGVRAGRAGGLSAPPSPRACGTKWPRGLPGAYACPQFPRQPAAARGRPPGRQGALPPAPRRPALSHKSPRRRPADLFPAPIMAVSGGVCGWRPGCAVSIRRHPPSAGRGRAMARAGGSGGGREEERCGAGMGREEPAGCPGEAAAMTGRGLPGGWAAAAVLERGPRCRGSPPGWSRARCQAAVAPWRSRLRPLGRAAGCLPVAPR